MSFWLLAAGLAALVLLALLRPLILARGTGPSSAAYDIEVYRDQLRELERAVAAGEIEPEEAEASRTEIARRLLAADQRLKAAKAAEAGGQRNLVQLSVIALVVLLPLGSVALYTTLGNPGMPAQPFSDRASSTLVEDTAESEDLRRLTEEAQSLSQRLAEDPEDVEAWVALGRVRLALRNYSPADEAFRAAQALIQADETGARAGISDAGYAEILAMRGEARTLAMGGQVTPDARAVFEEALERNPQDPRARFYLALLRYQSGDLRSALERWADLAATAPRGAGWMPLVLSRMEEVEEQLGIPPGTTAGEIMERRRAEEAARVGAGEGVQDFTPEERAQVEAMVAGLANRLAEEPEDLEGWLRLAQSYEVLGDSAAAATAWGEAARLNPEDAGLLTRQARALRAASGETNSPETLALMRRAVEIDPENPEALWFLALDAVERGERAEAEAYFARVLQALPPEAPETEELRRQSERILEGLGD